MRPTALPTAPRGRLRLTSEGLAWFAAAAVLGALGWIKSLNLLLLLAYVMLALLVVNGILARAQALRVRAKRLPHPPVFAGEDVRTTIVLQNTSTKPATLTVQDGSALWSVEQIPALGT